MLFAYVLWIRAASESADLCGEIREAMTRLTNTSKMDVGPLVPGCVVFGIQIRTLDFLSTKHLNFGQGLDCLKLLAREIEERRSK